MNSETLYLHFSKELLHVIVMLVLAWALMSLSGKLIRV